MNKPLGLRGLAICLIFLPGVAAAEGGLAQASAGVARAAKPGCAKLVCQQRRAFSADRGVSPEQRAAESTPSGLSVLVAVGAGAFHGPVLEEAFVSIAEVIQDYPEAPPGSVRIDSGGPVSADEPSSSRRTKVEGPTVSLGVSLEQPLASAAALRLGLEERLTLTALLSLSSGSCFAGLGDILLTARQANWPVQLAVGPSLAVAQLNVRDDEAELFAEAGVIVGGAALLRLDLAHALPATLDLVGHYGKPLNYEEGSSYRDLQLAFALRL